MATLKGCLSKIGLSKHESAFLRGAVKDHLDEGYTAHEAASAAVSEYLKQLHLERAGLVDQIKAQGGSDPKDPEVKVNDHQQTETPGLAPAPNKPYLWHSARRLSESEKQNLAEAHRLIAKQVDLFRYPSSGKKSLADITAEVSPGTRVTDISKMYAKNGETIWRLETTPPKPWRVMDESADSIPGTVLKRFDTREEAVAYAQGKPDMLVKQIPDSSILVTKEGRRVFVNAMNVGEGMGGGKMYAIVGDFARNNGLVFYGDPDGITQAGMRRRLENMTALALKHGDTSAIRPHADMVNGWPEADLKWRENHDNLHNLLSASYNVVKHIAPEVESITYNQGRFYKDGHEFTNHDFEDLAQQLHDGSHGEGAPGSGSLKNAALTSTLIQRADREGWGPVLASIGVGRPEAVWSGLERTRNSARRQTETPEFKKWFGDSKVVDDEGKPLVVYHGTAGSFDKFRRSRQDIGMHFGTAGQAADRLEFQRGIEAKPEAGMNTMPVYLSLTNPIRIQDMGSWGVSNMAYKLWELFPGDKARIGRLKTTKGVSEFLQSKGYDGVVYRNTGEVSGSQSYRDVITTAREALHTIFPKSKSGFSKEDQQRPEYQAWSQAQRDYDSYRDSNGEDSYIVFEPTQIKSAIGNTGAFSPKNPDIRYSARRDSVSVEGIHYSREQRDTLDGRSNGTGAKGAEDQRIREATDPRLKSRVNFYVDEGQGTKPEEGVGAAEHHVKLDNLYDMATDPLKLRSPALWSANKDTAMQARNDMESAMLDSGYDGYYAKGAQNHQGVAVVMGDAAHDIQVTKRGDGRGFTEFFSKATRGEGGTLPHGEYHKVIDLPESTHAFSSEYQKHTGNFDNHIKSSIPGFGEVQQATGRAIVHAFPHGNLLDIGASEGSWAKAISARSEGSIKTVSLDPNPDMAEFFKTKSTVPGAEYDMSALGSRAEEGKPAWDDISFFKPDRKFDIVHESMVFQFIDNDRPAQIARVKELMAKDGIALFEEKFVEDTPEWHTNEAKKDQYKAQYFTADELVNKKKEVLEKETATVGMHNLMTSSPAFERVLKDNFAHVTQYWDSGNFKGYAASDSAEKIDKFLGALPDLNSEYSTVETPSGVKLSPRRDENLGFYSALQRGVEDLQQGKGKPNQWTGIIKNLKGVKPEEIENSGVNEWLAAHDGVVSKSDLVDFLKAGGVKLEEVELGKPPGEPTVDFEEGRWVVRGGSGKEFGRYISEADATSAKARAIEYSRLPTQYHRYVAPGGENYRELLLTLPQTDKGKPEPLTMLPEGYESIYDSQAPAGREWGVTPPGQIHARPMGDRHPTEAAAKEEALNLVNNERLSSWAVDHSKGQFKSAHWDQPNILAHLRFDERTDADGNRVMHIAEVQSDWGQKGRKNGFLGEQKDLDDKIAAGYPVPKDRGDWSFTVLTKAGVPEDLAGRWMDAHITEGKVPDAPFVKNTASWALLAMKRAISYAAENGFDKITWDNSATQAERYDLSKSYKEITWQRKPDGTYFLHATDKEDDVHGVGDHILEEKLEDFVGKDLAKKIVASEGKWTTTESGTEIGTLSGLDLKVGGEGMSGFYDRLLPNEMNKYLKKWGEKVTDHGFTVNDKMREDVMTNGQPLFSPRRDALVAATKGFADDVVNDLQIKATPMAAGSDRARAVAKDYANAERLARWQWAKFDDTIKSNFDADQRKAMWEAGDEEGVLRQQGKSTKGKGLDRLPSDQRAVMDTLHQYGEDLLQRAKDVGMFKGEGLPYWVPRMAVMIGGDGEYFKPTSGEASGSAQGRNISTSSQNLKERKYLTAEDTEAAMQGKLGENAQLVRDIRTMPMAMARLERAIAGRELINQIKDIGTKTGQTTVSSSEAPEFFTLDHPAFRTFRPRFIENEDGKMVAATDQNGDMMFDKVPVYVSKEFEGPLKSIMSGQSGKIYQAFMALKGKSMSVIMYSPLIHNAVEWGRAMPVAPGKVMTGIIYFEGNKAKNDPELMREAIGAGLVPIGHRGGIQDITGIMEDPTMEIGRSWTAKALAAPFGIFSKDSATAVKKAVDWAGNHWHNTLLWDRVGDLQMGLYLNVKAAELARGLDERSATLVAAHFANRYAGAIPNESMSVNARKFANLLLFSRSFTLGNLGVMKDMFTGLPRDVQSQIKMESGELALQSAKSAGRKKAISAFILDVGLLYAGNAIFQNALDILKRDETLDDVLKGYADRFDKLVNTVREDPLQLIKHPLGSVESLMPNSENEPGKENRIHYGEDEHGTATYLRLPTGKVGEEFTAWANEPIAILQRKLSQFARPVWQTMTNDKGFGRRVYDPDAQGWDAWKTNAARIAWNFMSQQIPMTAIEGGSDWFQGHATDVDKMKVVGPMVGLTFSKGAPGGPEMGVMYAADKAYRGRLADVRESVNHDIKIGDIDTATAKLEAIGMPAREIANLIRSAESPESRMNKSMIKRFQQHAIDAEKEKLDRMQSK